jgi:uncharacterized protein (TIGR03086 family)
MRTWSFGPHVTAASTEVEPYERTETMPKQMTRQTEYLRRAFISTQVVLEVVQPDQLGAQTPCASWDVRGLINHFVGSAHWAVAALVGNEVPEGEFATGDFRARYEESMHAALDAFGSDGALESMVRLPFGEVTGADLMGIVTGDQFTHGWDLARSIGHRTDLDPELADALLVQAQRMIPLDSRGADGVAPFGPVVRPPEGASPADRLAAFLGRSM